MTEGPWLVTGASGFLGRHVLQEIQASSTTRRTVVLVRDPDEWRGMEWTRTLERVTPLVGSVTETAEHDSVERLARSRDSPSSPRVAASAGR